MRERVRVDVREGRDERERVMEGVREGKGERETVVRESKVVDSSKRE